MRSFIVLAFAAVVSIFVPCAAEAAGRSSNASEWYFASDAGVLVGQGGGAADTISLGIGYRFNRYFAVEGGYSGLFDRDATANGGYLNAYGYIPLDHRSRFLLFGTVGGTYIGSVSLGNNFYSASSSGVQGGGGFEWRISRSWSVRAAVRYQTAIVDGVTSSVGFSVRL